MIRRLRAARCLQPPPQDTQDSSATALRCYSIVTQPSLPLEQQCPGLGWLKAEEEVRVPGLGSCPDT